MRRGWIRQGRKGNGRLRLFTGPGRCALIRLSYDLVDPYEAFLRLNYTSAIAANERVNVDQRVPLTFTEPHFGGRRWWMICPYGGRRVAKLLLPPGGNRFASREEWQLVYLSQCQGERARAFERLFRLQRKLGCDERWGAEPSRPKGMWHSTFKGFLQEYRDLDTHCGDVTDLWVAQFRERHG